MCARPPNSAWHFAFAPGLPPRFPVNVAAVAPTTRVGRVPAQHVIGRAWVQSTPVMPLMMIPSGPTVRQLYEIEAPVHALQLLPVVAERPALVPAAITELPFSLMLQSIHALLAGAPVFGYELKYSPTRPPRLPVYVAAVKPTKLPRSDAAITANPPSEKTMPAGPCGPGGPCGP